jgi:hypothetical protein
LVNWKELKRKRYKMCHEFYRSNTGIVGWSYTYRWMDGWMDEWMGGQMCGRKDGRMDGLTVRRVYNSAYVII